MKILITETETYSIRVPEELNAKQFQAFVSRLQDIGKLLKRDVILDATELISSKVSKKQITRKSHYSKHPREAYLALMTAYHSGDKVKLASQCSKYGYTPKSVKTNIQSWRKKFKVEAKEVGLIRFPRRGEGRIIARLQLKNKKEENNATANNSKEKEEKEARVW